MATPGELAAGMEREIWDHVRVMKHFRNKLDDRAVDPVFVGSGTDAVILRNEYIKLDFLARGYIDSIQEVWRGLRRWADQYNGIPDTRFDDRISDAPVAQLTKMMATSNALDRAQFESGFTNEDFPATGTIWEKFYGILDPFVEMCILLRGRSGWYSDEWQTLGSGDRAQEAKSLMEELLGVAAFGRNVLADSAVSIRNYQREELAPRRNRVRREYIARPAVTGGIYLLNRGAVPAGGPTPVEVDPGIDTVGTFPALANGPPA